MNLSFEYKYEAEPAVPVRVRSRSTGKEVVVDAVVDTGSNVTVLESWVFDFLLLESDSRANVTGIGGVLLGVSLAEVEVDVLLSHELRTTVTAAILPVDAPPIGNLIGTDVLRRLDFAVSHSNGTLYFGLAT